MLLMIWLLKKLALEGHGLGSGMLLLLIVVGKLLPFVVLNYGRTAPLLFLLVAQVVHLMMVTDSVVSIVAIELLVMVRLKSVLVREILGRTAVNLLLLLYVRRLFVLIAAEVRCLEDHVQLAHVVNISPCACTFSYHLLFFLLLIDATLWSLQQAFGNKGHE